jgi:hypothetical protein
MDILESMADQTEIEASVALPKLGAVIIKMKSEGLAQWVSQLGALFSEKKGNLNDMQEEWAP